MKVILFSILTLSLYIACGVAAVADMDLMTCVFFILAVASTFVLFTTTDTHSNTIEEK